MAIQEGVSGPVHKMAGVLGATATNQTAESFNCILDTSGVLTTVSDTDKVLLWKFLKDNGTVAYLRYDRSDNNLVIAES